METLKSEIKKLAEMQIVLRDQRKSVFNKLERTIEPYKAVYMHSNNRQVLREMYAAYGLLRGKSLEEVEANYGNTENEYCPYKFKYTKIHIDKLVEAHKSEFIKDEETVCISE